VAANNKVATLSADTQDSGIETAAPANRTIDENKILYLILVDIEVEHAIGECDVCRRKDDFAIGIGRKREHRDPCCAHRGICQQALL
jgi:hypothetical protein